MSYQAKPLPFDPKSISGISEKVLVSHYENNYGGAVKRLNAISAQFVNQWAADHTTTLAGGRPVLVLDMYEHAYHMDFGAAAARYVDIYMEAIRWDNASALYDQYARES